MAKRESIYNGVLLVNKPQDFTSHDVVAKLRGILHERRIGHGGTLDPMATGVLPVFVGGATKAADYAAAQSKEYVAGFALGHSTDTQDSTGTVLAHSVNTALREDVQRVLAQMQGNYDQLPPMYSAIKVDGRKLYDLARKGVEIERKTRPIVLHELELLSFDEQEQTGTLRVLCSKGTYVRTVCHDLGEKLGTLAVMTSLVRTASGHYALGQTHTLEDIQRAADENRIAEWIIPTDTLFADYPAVEITDKAYARAENGAFMDERETGGLPAQDGVLCRVYHRGEFFLLARTGTLDKGGRALFHHKRFR